MLLPALTALSVPMPGAPMDRPVTDPGVQQAAAFAVQAFNKASNSAFYYKAMRIVSARSQVVEGVKYYLTVELVNTLCEKKGGSGLNHVDLEHCAVASVADQRKQTCEFQVWFLPRLNDTRLEYMSCKAASS
uniref:Cystatin-Abr-1 n=1 Tax=Abronia graminea TaxID=278977 RepID=K4I4J3_ABRGR